MGKLPILPTVVRAYSFLFREMGTIFRLSWVALLAVQSIAILVDLKFGSNAKGLAGWLAGLVSLSAASIVAVAIHRVILFEESHPGLYFYFHFSKVEFLFALMPVLTWLSIVIGSLLLILGVGRIFSVFSSDNAYVASLVLVSPLLYLVFRLSIVFPIIVVERRIDLARAWELTRENSWRFLAILLLTDGVFYCLDYAIQKVMAAPAGSSSSLIVVALPYQILTQMVGLALGVAALSYSYKFLSGHKADDILRPRD